MNKARKVRSAVIDTLLQEITPQIQQQVERRMNLAAQIYDAIQEKGLTNQEFAYLMGKKPSETSRWLSGTHNFTTETLWEIERVLSIQLLTSSVQKDPKTSEEDDIKTFVVTEVEKALSKYYKRNTAISA
jgi:ribosome-binding protein aMBF1 (putative translation factor)